ncbi:MAG: hypothetical protein GY870_05230 [archaeon]|nr:hypothetical protein [archaeon]
MKVQNNGDNNEGIVKIMPKAYITMVRHVLTYGNNALDSSVEVMGICMGKEEGNDIIVYEAVPVSHGGAIEVGFTETDYAAFASVDEKYANDGRGLYACGWYHSHPGLKAFFSLIDKKNHLFYQKEQTPKGFGIVFDHTYFNEPENPGFEVFRLDDYKKGTSSDFHSCKFELITPDDLSIYGTVQEIIELAQSKQMFIKEISALDVDDSVWDTTEEKSTTDKETSQIPLSKIDDNKELKELVGAHNKGLEAFSMEFTEKFMYKFDEFKNDTSRATQKGSEVMVDVLATMKQTVDKGVTRVKEYLENVLNEEIEATQNSVEEMLNKFEDEQSNFSKEFDEFSNTFSNDLKSLIKGILDNKLDSFIKLIGETAEYAKDIGANSDEFKDSLKTQNDILTEIKDNIEKDKGSIKTSINNAKDNIGKKINDKNSELNNSVKEIKVISGEISKLIKELEKKVSKS